MVAEDVSDAEGNMEESGGEDVSEAVQGQGGERDIEGKDRLSSGEAEEEKSSEEDEAVQLQEEVAELEQLHGAGAEGEEEEEGRGDDAPEDNEGSDEEPDDTQKLVVIIPCPLYSL